MNISYILQKWYHQHHRELPWRNTRDPYKIWLSEIILQQTRVTQGLSYYHRFIDKYPTVDKLANAPDDEVMRLWQGLGYYSRARNVLKTARIILTKHNSVFPKKSSELLKLPGVGSYSSAAVASFAFDECIPVIDGNVNRVICRLFDIEIPVNEAKGKSMIRELANELIDCKDPSTHNQAMMEFGALQCIPGTPNCQVCPLMDICQAFKKGNQKSLPVKKKKNKVTTRYFIYLDISFDDNTYIYKRNEKDIWHSLYEFIMIESKHALKPANITKTDEWAAIFKHHQPVIQYISKVYIHLLTHQCIHANFIKIVVNKPFSYKNVIMIQRDEIVQYGISRLTERYLIDHYPNFTININR